jgi:hypothetical protein
MSDSERYVAHLTFTAPDLEHARGFGRTLARSVSFLSEVLVPETTVSREDDQGVQYRLFCARLLDGGRRCVLRAEHEPPCSPRMVGR